MQFDLVFEGGGAKGMVFVGALRALAEAGHTHGRLLGTSAGGISACLLAVDYSHQELATALTEQTKDGRPVFETFMGTPGKPSREDVRSSNLRAFLEEIDLPGVPNFIERHLDDALVGLTRSTARGRHLFQLTERGGWFSARMFERWLRERLNSGTFRGKPRNFGDCTLGELAAATGADLSLVATNTSDARMMVLNHRTAPDMPVVKAVRATMNIPFVWPEVVWKKRWGSYRGQRCDDQCLVDGGAVSNFPLELFVSQMPEVVAIMGKAQSEGGAIGMLVDEKIPVPGVRIKKEEGRAIMRTQTVGRVQRLINTMMVAHDKMVIESLAHRVVRLPAGGIDTMDFGMPTRRREKLVDGGYQVVARYLEDLDSILNDGPAFFGEESPADTLALRALGL